VKVASTSDNPPNRWPYLHPTQRLSSLERNQRHHRAALAQNKVSPTSKGKKQYIRVPRRRQDICYGYGWSLLGGVGNDDDDATENRQVAVKSSIRSGALGIVVGSRTGFELQRLVDSGAQNLGTNAHLIDSYKKTTRAGFGVRERENIALTRGALSAPSVWFLRKRKLPGKQGFGTVQNSEVMPENVRSGLPPRCWRP